MSRQLLTIPDLDHDTTIYLAGLIDGEGCFYIAHHVKNMQKSTYSPQFKIVLTDENTINWISNKLKRGYTYTIANPGKNQQDTYSIRIADRVGLVKFIKQILPFMITKKEVAQIMMNFCESRIDNWNKNNSRKLASSYSESEVNFYNQIKFLNSVGVRKVAYSE